MVMLDTWPPFPIDIWAGNLNIRNVDNIVEALEHNDRIHKIKLWDSSMSHVKQVLAAMRKPFSSLTELAVNFFDERASLVVPDLFLSGSAPFLRSLRLRSVQFPLPIFRNLLQSADLVELRIWRIPNSGFISPEDVVAYLSGLSRLTGSKNLNWGSDLPFVGQVDVYLVGTLPPRSHLPSTRQLGCILSHQLILDTSQLAQFVDRTPRLKALRELRIFFDGSVFVSLPCTRLRGLHFGITHTLPDQFPRMVQLCTSSFLRTLIPMKKHLYILDSDTSSSYWLPGVESSQWLNLLHPFTDVEDLYLSQEFSPHIVPTMHGINGEGMTEMLPTSLQNLFTERLSPPGSIEEAIEQLTALNLASRPIAVSRMGQSKMTIDMVPDVALLESFDFYVAAAQASDHLTYNGETWITLVHVCRKWRDIVFASPRRLNLRLLVTRMSSVELMLDTWPPLLIDIWGFGP
ncbi:hypothetical protein BGY98DRAFT_1100195 [Russula aff. rugulosa BPL654]|nr:hypothetical protein BGY98DRAFT_1100195 [Russula aff. rugulosa BPL654]